MSIARLSFAANSGRGIGFWSAVAVLEAGAAACSMALIAFGPFFQSSRPWLWLVGAAALLLVYLGMALWSTFFHLSGGYRGSLRGRWLLFISTLPFLAGFSAMLSLLQFRPGTANAVWYVLSPIQPFPLLAMAIVLLLVFLVKLLAVSLALEGRGLPVDRLRVVSADLAIPVALLLMGVLEASVYLTPIGNAFLRFWALADSLSAGTLWTAYPVTLTEPAPIAAGSPPYVYDLPLFPLMLQGVFGLFGHNSTAAFLPAAFWNALFPLSLYLLIGKATGSRVTGILFAALASLFPYLRLYVLNLPDPDPLLLTSLCLAGYFYLRALAAPERLRRWVVAGIAAGILSLARPEGLLYAGCLGLGALASRPGIRQLALYALALMGFVGPMAALWMANFGFLWPQNYNRTLGLGFPRQNYGILEGNGSLRFYSQGLGLDERWALALFLLFVSLVLLGVLLMAFRDRRLLALAVPGIGNTVMIFFANPAIPNSYHYADFFRHASFGMPLLVLTAAYACHRLYRYLTGGRLKTIGYLCLLLLVVSVVREGDILANPTLTHRPPRSWPAPTQVLPTYTHLSMQAILGHPLPLQPMTYYRQEGMTIAQPTFMTWPDDALEFFKPLDMSFESAARPFSYASVVAFLLALAFALLAAGRTFRPGPSGAARKLEEAG